MPRFKLKHGDCDFKGRIYKYNDPDNNIVECDENLAAWMPEKFERIDDRDLYQYPPQTQATYPGPQAHRLPENVPDEPTPAPSHAQAPAPAPHLGKAPTSNMPPLTPTTALRDNKDGKTLEEKYGALDAMTVHDLKEVAAAEEIDLKGATKKEDILRVMRGK